MIIKLCTLLLLLTTVQCQYNSKGGRFEQQKDGSQSQQRPDVNDDGSDGNSVEAGPEPPSVIPQTNFICEDKPYPLGMYADLETGCTVYHMCFDGRKESFLCGTGTVFNQEILSCDHPQNVVCEDSPKYYDANTELGKSVPEPNNGGGQRPVPGGGGQRPIPGGGGQRPIPGGGPVQRPVPGGGPSRPLPGGGPGPRPVPGGGPGPRPVPGRPDYPRPIGPGPGPVQRPAPIPSGPDGPEEYDRPAVVPRPVQPRPIQPRPQPGKPVGPRPVPSGPGKPSPGKPGKPRPPPSVGRPLPPTAVRPRPRPVEPQRPIVQTSDDGQLDYEPSALSYYQQKPEASFRRAYFARPARQWRLMSESYA